jgi:formate dehydrogenase major subunit
MEKVKLTIDGMEITANAGANILDAAMANGIYIPHLCHHPDLTPVGACRMCEVEVGGRNVMSCLTPVADGLDVKTDTPAIRAARQMNAELLIANHHQECLSCGSSHHCELLHVADHVGVNGDRLLHLTPRAELLPVDMSNPFFKYDPNKCIACGICVRTCDEIVGLGVLSFIERGNRTVIGTFADKPFIESICESCGECVVRCPVGALAPKKALRPSHEVQSTCVYCGVGCGIYLGVKGDRVVSVRADEERPSNQGSLCVKGRFGYNFINHPDRLTTPLIKKEGEFVEATWDEALDLVAEKLAPYKGNQFAALASAKCTNEDNYLIQKFTRAVMQTNNVDHCARL